MDKLYTIQEVATKLNVSDKTLRRWEEAGRFRSSRTLGNQRRYSLEDVQILDALKHGTISEQKDLLTIEQASKLCGVSPTTLIRWENDGKIHPFITAGNTYYPRTRLVEKMDELKKIYSEPTPPVVAPIPPPKTVTPSTALTSAPNPSQTVYDWRPTLVNAIVTLILIFTYHMLINRPLERGSDLLSPQDKPPAGSVQGASTIPDPRLDDLITKFQDHLSAEMLKDAKPTPITTINLDNTSLITGTAVLPKGKNQILVPADKITLTTPVTATFTSDYAPAKKFWITAGEDAFTLNTDFPVGADSAFNYSFLAPTSTPSASAN